MKISKKYLKQEKTLSTETLPILLKLVELESVIDYNTNLLHYLSTQINSSSNIVETVLQKQDILEKELNYYKAVYLKTK